MTIRLARIDDIPSIKAIELECRLSPWSIDNYEAEVHRANSALLVATGEDGQIVGFLAGRVIPGAEAEIGNIGVKQQERMHGVGGRLLEAFVALVKSVAASRVFLEVRVSNEVAIGFYEAHGFRKVGRRKNFYLDPKEDGFTMALDLSPALH